MQITSIFLFLAKGALLHDLSKTKLLSFAEFWVEPIGQAAQISLIIACILTVYSGINYLVKYWTFFTGKEL